MIPKHNIEKPSPEFLERHGAMTEMPKEIWAMDYEGSTGHGEWDDYQPFDPCMSTKYIRADLAGDGMNVSTKWHLISAAAPPEGKLLFGCYHVGKWYETMARFGHGVGGDTVNIPTGFRRYSSATHWMSLPSPPPKPNKKGNTP